MSQLPQYKINVHVLTNSVPTQCFLTNKIQCQYTVYLQIYKSLNNFVCKFAKMSMNYFKLYVQMWNTQTISYRQNKLILQKEIDVWHVNKWMKNFLSFILHPSQYNKIWCKNLKKFYSRQDMAHDFLWHHFLPRRPFCPLLIWMPPLPLLAAVKKTIKIQNTGWKRWKLTHEYC